MFKRPVLFQQHYLLQMRRRQKYAFLAYFLLFLSVIFFLKQLVPQVFLEHYVFLICSVSGIIKDICLKYLDDSLYIVDFILGSFLLLLLNPFTFN